MGNAPSQKTFTIVNDSLVNDTKHLKTQPVSPDKETNFKIGKASAAVSGDGRLPQEVYASQEQELQAALEPFKKVINKDGSNSNASVEKEKLMECFKKNPGNTLSCSSEIKNFVNFVNKLPAGTNRP